MTGGSLETTSFPKISPAKALSSTTLTVKTSETWLLEVAHRAKPWPTD